MVYFQDLRWCSIVLYYATLLDKEDISFLLGTSGSTIQRWNHLFETTWQVLSKARSDTASRYEEVLDYIRRYVENDPTLFLSELQEGLKERFPDLRNIYFNYLQSS